MPVTRMEIKTRGILWEIVTATDLLTAGADILILRHPESVRVLKQVIADVMEYLYNGTEADKDADGKPIPWWKLYKGDELVGMHTHDDAMLYVDRKKKRRRRSLQAENGLVDFDTRRSSLARHSWSHCEVEHTKQKSQHTPTTPMI